MGAKIMRRGSRKRFWNVRVWLVVREKCVSSGISGNSIALNRGFDRLVLHWCVLCSGMFSEVPSSFSAWEVQIPELVSMNLGWIYLYLCFSLSVLFIPQHETISNAVKSSTISDYRNQHVLRY